MNVLRCNALAVHNHFICASEGVKHTRILLPGIECLSIEPECVEVIHYKHGHLIQVLPVRFFVEMS